MFDVPVDAGVLHGHVRSSGDAWAVVLHGGPGLPDYTAGCAAELDGVFSTIRYTQRGTHPSTVGGPFTVESHLDDVLSVLDAQGVDRAWMVGHSWGGHLALHVAVRVPDRVSGVICVDTLGASPDIFPEFSANLTRRLPDAQRDRVRELQARKSAGRASESDRIEEMSILWSQYFADPALAGPLSIERVGVECGLQTNRSIAEHFASRTLERALPDLRLPVLFIHGEADPLPSRASTQTASLIPGAHVVLIPECGHFPWIEKPGAIRAAIDEWMAPTPGAVDRTG